MYFVPDGTKICGYYECEDCGMRFLSVAVAPCLICPYCGEEVDMELGPDEEMPEAPEAAKLIKVVRDEEVEMMDTLLSLAITSGFRRSSHDFTYCASDTSPLAGRGCREFIYVCQGHGCGSCCGLACAHKRGGEPEDY